MSLLFEPYLYRPSKKEYPEIIKHEILQIYEKPSTFKPTIRVYTSNEEYIEISQKIDIRNINKIKNIMEKGKNLMTYLNPANKHTLERKEKHGLKNPIRGILGEEYMQTILGTWLKNYEKIYENEKYRFSALEYTEDKGVILNPLEIEYYKLIIPETSYISSTCYVEKNGENTYYLKQNNKTIAELDAFYIVETAYTYKNKTYNERIAIIGESKTGRIKISDAFINAIHKIKKSPYYDSVIVAIFAPYDKLYGLRNMDMAPKIDLFKSIYRKINKRNHSKIKMIINPFIIKYRGTYPYEVSEHLDGYASKMSKHIKETLKREKISVLCELNLNAEDIEKPKSNKKEKINGIILGANLDLEMIYEDAKNLSKEKFLKKYGKNAIIPLEP